jgi:L-alanine-DL-glutamate epimerase-like enolase superfamily enzyme
MIKRSRNLRSTTCNPGRREFLRAGLYGLGTAAALPLIPSEAAAESAEAPGPSRAPKMRVTDVKVEIYESAVREPAYKRWLIWTGKVPESLQESKHRMGLLRVFTDAGIEGICPVRDTRSAHELADAVRPLVIGRDPLDREFIWHTLWKMERIYHFSMYTHSAIDIALWDIAAKAAGLPLYKLLGAYTDKVPMYRSSTLLLTPEEFVEDALKARAGGYRAYKLHPAGDVEIDIASCRAVREAVGDEFGLMLDPIGAYDHEEAMKIGREIERLGFLWFEEPLPEWDIRGHAELARALDIPICGPEVLPGGPYLTADYIDQRAVDIVRADIVLKGGITGVMKTAHLAEAFGMNIELHITYSPFTNAAQLHVACAIPNTLFVERLGSDEMNAMWERAYGSPDFWMKPDPDGNVGPPDVPGMGVEVDRDLLGKPVAVL